MQNVKLLKELYSLTSIKKITMEYSLLYVRQNRELALSIRPLAYGFMKIK